jgi:Mrp family chromosome partitioning ATPase
VKTGRQPACFFQGGSTLTANLAVWLAKQGRDTIIVDTDNSQQRILRKLLVPLIELIERLAKAAFKESKVK